MNSVFFPQSLLDILFDIGKLDIEGEDLVVKEHGFRYRVGEAVRVLTEVTTGEDPHNLCGRVAMRTYLSDELGAEILGNSMLVEDNAYDVVPGMVGEPVGAVAPDARPEHEVLAELQNLDDV